MIDYLPHTSVLGSISSITKEKKKVGSRKRGEKVGKVEKRERISAQKN